MKHAPSSYLLTLILIIGLTLTGCGGTYIKVLVPKPSEANMGKFKRIAIGNFTGERANLLTFDLKQDLLENGRFEVLDFNNLNAILREHNLSLNAVTEGTSVREATEVLGATALISGDIITDDYAEDVKKGKKYTDDKGKSHVIMTLVGKGTISVNFQITDLTTGKIIYLKNIKKTREKGESAADRKPKFDDDEINSLMASVRADVVNSFIDKIIPHQYKVSVEMLEDDELPQMKRGIDYASMGEWGFAADIFKQEAEKPVKAEAKSKAYYNLGVCYQYSLRFDDAVRAYDKALSLYPDELYSNSIRKCRQMEEDYKKLNDNE